MFIVQDELLWILYIREVYNNLWECILFELKNVFSGWWKKIVYIFVLPTCMYMYPL